MAVTIHKLAEVSTDLIGDGTTIWQFAVVLAGARIGANCNINCHTFVEGGVVLGNNVTVKSGVYLWDGIVVDDDAFLGPSVVFTNDIRPRSKRYVTPTMTRIGRGASLGANSTILAGVTIGEYAMTGIGSVVTRDVRAHSLVYGNPAKHKGWVDEGGVSLLPHADGVWKSESGSLYRETGAGLTALGPTDGR